MQRQVRGLADPFHDEGAMRLKHPFAVPTHLAGRNRPVRTVALRPLHHRRHRNTEPRCNRPAALPANNRRYNALSKIIGKGSGH
jgi:hypothetical protein